MEMSELKFKVKESVKQVDPYARVILFGSQARGDGKKYSDWDFLILTSRKADEKIKTRIRNALIDTELEAEQVISAIIYSQNSWHRYKITPLYRNIEKEGVEV
jgi:predicted nucleotidyltransferase